MKVINRFGASGKFGLTGCAVAAAMLTLPAVTQASIIDDFVDPVFVNVDTVGGGTSTAVQSPVLALGGERTLTLEAISGGTTSAAIVLGSGTLRFGTDGGTLASVTSTYSGITSFDATDSGTDDAFEVLLSFLDGAADVTVTANGVSATQSVAGPAGASLLIFGFNDFAGVNFSNITSLSLKVVTTASASDINIDRFSTSLVPEPGTLVLAAGGLAMMVRVRLRDRSRA